MICENITCRGDKDEEFQFGCLADYVALAPKNGKPEKQWAGPDDFKVTLNRLSDRLREQSSKILRIDYCASPDLSIAPKLCGLSDALTLKDLNFDGFTKEGPA
jgi:hypothetical protein